MICPTVPKIIPPKSYLSGSGEPINKSIQTVSTLQVGLNLSSGLTTLTLTTWVCEEFIVRGNALVVNLWIHCKL